MKSGTGELQTIALFGGTSEIGLAILRTFVGPSTERIVLACRDTVSGQTVADTFDERITVDVIEWEARDLAAGPNIISMFGGDHRDIDLVIIAAATLGEQSAFDADPVLAGEAVVINTASPIATLSATASQMTAQGHGNIIVLSSVAGVRVRSDNRVYGASKSGLDSYALALANELDDTGVEITVVRPGFVHGRMTDGMKPAPFATDPATVASATHNAVAAGRRVVWVPRVLQLVFAVFRVLPNSIWRRIRR
ncbi:MAG: SDR family NAD(P)-dependent oxidoreductase [Ilumatobacteraceae bacterium]